METKWPLVIFTLFVCVSSGLLGTESFMLYKGKGQKLMMPTLIASAVALVIGGLGSFTHLQHWERIFNGFGHITSGITQEIIGCVLMGVIMVIWFVFWYRKKEIKKPLAIVTIVICAIMVIATGHSYMMAARPAWMFVLIFYIGNAVMLGAIGMWGIITFRKETKLENAGKKLAFWGSIIGLGTTVLYTICLLFANVWDFGYYADPTALTTAPTHVSSLFGEAVAGSGAIFFWAAIVTAILVLACVFIAKKKNDKVKPVVLPIVAIVCALATSVFMRIVIYIVGYTMYLMF